MDTIANCHHIIPRALDIHSIANSLRTGLRQRHKHRRKP